MQCPECHANHDADAAACTSCGLILVAAPPQRRATDLASQRRRAADHTVECQFCRGEIPGNAIRCKHCGEIVNESYYRDRAQRIRARVNYSSWILYLFGLATLLLFRPVGLLAIAAGLLLSIAYYAIPVDPPQGTGGKRKSLTARLRRQLKFERVAIPIPHLRNKKLIFIGTPLVAALIGYSTNAFLLQAPMDQILRENSAFNGMDVSAHYEYWIVPGVVVYDLRDLSFRQTPIDVHTAFLEFAKRLRNRRYQRVELSYRGTEKFEIDGGSFRRLGQEYAKRNFDFVLYTFPRLFRSVSGEHAVPPSGSDRDALLEFHREWYGNDQMTKSIANGL